MVMEFSFTTTIIILHYITASMGLLENILLLYLIVTSTPKVLKPYSVLVFNCCLVDTLASICSILNLNRIVPAGVSLGYIFHGACTWIGPDFCFDCYSFMLHLYVHSYLIIFASFVYRYKVLFNPNIRFSAICVFCVIIYIPSLFFHIIYCYDKSDSEAVTEIISAAFPAYNLTQETISGHTNLFAPLSFAYILYITLPITPVYCGIFWFRKNIYKSLREKSKSFSEQNLKTHRQLTRCISVQACLPCFFLLSVICFGLMEFGIYQDPIVETLTVVWVNFIPLFSPLTSIYFIKAYKEKACQIFHIPINNDVVRKNIAGSSFIPTSQNSQLFYS